MTEYRIIRHAEGDEREDHKYVARVLIKKGTGKKKNVYRYFYDKKEYQAYLDGLKKTEQEEKNNKLSDMATKLLSGKLSTKSLGSAENFVNSLFNNNKNGGKLSEAVKNKTSEASMRGKDFVDSFLGQNGKTKVGKLQGIITAASKVVNFVTNTLTRGLGVATIAAVITNMVEKKAEEKREEYEQAKSEKEKEFWDNAREQQDSYSESKKKAAENIRNHKIEQATAEYEAAKQEAEDSWLKKKTLVAELEKEELDRLRVDYDNKRRGETDAKELKRLQDTYEWERNKISTSWANYTAIEFEKHNARLAELDANYKLALDKIEREYLEATGQEVPNAEFVEFPDLDQKLREYSEAEDQALVNPNYDPDAYTEALIAYANGDMDAIVEYNKENYEYNCSYCTATYDLRRRGYDVEAMPIDLYNDDITNNTEILSWYEDAELVTGSDIMRISQSQIDSQKPLSERQVEDFIESLEEQEDGSYGHLFLYWANNGGGHDVIWEIENGEAIVRDCQTNQTLDPREYLENCCYAEYFRSDNLELADEIRRVVKNRS